MLQNSTFLVIVNNYPVDDSIIIDCNDIFDKSVYEELEKQVFEPEESVINNLISYISKSY